MTWALRQSQSSGVLSDAMSTIDTTSAVGSLLHQQRDQILEIAARHQARNVRVFGSVARGDATAASDIDFLVDFDKDSSLFDVLHLTEELEAVLGRNVDVVSTGGLKHRDDRIRAKAVDLGAGRTTSGSLTSWRRLPRLPQSSTGARPPGTTTESAGWP